MIRILIQELEDNGDHVQSMQFSMKEEFLTIDDTAFLFLADCMRKIPVLQESNHKAGNLCEAKVGQ